MHKGFVPGAGPSYMCGRPLGVKSKSDTDGRFDCDHVSGLLVRHCDRWPRWGPRPSPKHSFGFASRCTKRVLWIVGSTDCHLVQLFCPGTYARLLRSPAEAGQTLRASLRPMPAGSARCSLMAKAPVMALPPRRRWKDGGMPRRSSSAPRRHAPSCWQARRPRACAVCGAARPATTCSSACCQAAWPQR